MTFFHTFDSCESNISLSVERYNYYRSSNSHSTGKFCFEFVWNSGTGYHQVGFSNKKDERSFISYYYSGGNARFFTQPEYEYFDQSVIVAMGTVGMVCLDIGQAMLTIIKGIQVDHHIFGGFINSDHWFAYFDHSTGVSGKTIVTVNMGISPFINSLPEGYLPWTNIDSAPKCFPKPSFLESSLQFFITQFVFVINMIPK